MSQQPDTYNILEIQCMHSSDSARLFVDRCDYDQLRAENTRLKSELAEAKKTASLVDACHAFINSPVTVESCMKFNAAVEAMKGK